MAAATTSLAPNHRPPAGTVVLRTDGLTKHFGTIVAVDHLDLEVRAGEVLGFLGPNGSGKSTTAGMILGLIQPTAGRIELFGRALGEHGADLPRLVGAVIESPAFYPYLSGRDNLHALALAAGGVPRGRIDSLLELVGLTERADSSFKTYSLGMKQRLGIASTLLMDPALVILDEPTNGLDPAGQREVRDLIPQLAREGRAVLLASHLLHEVEQICDRVAIIQRGKLVESGAVRDLLRRESVLVIQIAEPERAAALVRDLPYVSNVTHGSAAITVQAPAEHGAEINRHLAEHGLWAASLVPRTSSLEDLFLELTDEGAAGAGAR